MRGFSSYMDLEVGAILTGKVTGIAKFGAFISLAPGKSGLVHISEIANSYVSSVGDFLQEGQEVKVKLIGIDGTGRINLSIKQAQEPQEQPQHQPRPQRPQFQDTPRQAPSYGNFQKQASHPSEDNSFEDKLKRFMQDSDNKISGIKQFAEKKSTRRKSGKS